MSTLRTAVIGVGAIGNLHARIYAQHPRCELVAVVDNQSARAEALAHELGCAAYTSVDAMLAAEQLDLVSVATPEQFRYEPAVACARAGIHLLLEKPLAAELAGTDRLISAVEASGVRATVNFILRSDIRYQAAQEQVSSGRIGEVCTIFARRRGTSLGAEIYGPWTDLLISTAIHDIDAMAWINGSPIERVFAEGVVKRCAEWGHEDAVVATFRFANGAVGILETSWVMPPTLPPGLDAAFQLAATGGAVEIAGSNYGLSVLTADGYRLPDLGNWPTLRSGIGGALQANLAAVVRALLDGGELPISLQEARAAHAVVAALKQSLAEGRPVVPAGR
jgi:predicted dehydrogenase